jgi:hypothetical protein
MHAYTHTHTYIHTYIFFVLFAPTFWSIGLIFQFLDHSQTVGLLGRVISSSQGLYLYRTTQTQKDAHTHTHQTSMPCVGFEPTISASERAKTVHALDLAATVTGTYIHINTDTYVCLVVCLFMCKLIVVSVPVCTRNGKNGWNFAYYALNKNVLS